MNREDLENIKANLKAPIRNSCFMISMTWWTKWQRSMEKEQFLDLTTLPAVQACGNSSTGNLAEIAGDASLEIEDSIKGPGQINNMDLIVVHNQKDLWPEVLKTENWSCIDWNCASLRKDIIEDFDYVLVSHIVWQRLKTIYGAGPEIQLFIVNDATVEDMNNGISTPSRYIGGLPDKDPITITLVSDSSSFSGTGRLVSKYMTIKALKSYASQIFMLALNKLKLTKCLPAEGERRTAKYEDIVVTTARLIDCGLKEKSVVFVSQEDHGTFEGGVFTYAGGMQKQFSKESDEKVQFDNGELDKLAGSSSYFGGDNTKLSDDFKWRLKNGDSLKNQRRQAVVAPVNDYDEDPELLAAIQNSLQDYNEHQKKQYSEENPIMIDMGRADQSEDVQAQGANAVHNTSLENIHTASTVSSPDNFSYSSRSAENNTNVNTHNDVELLYANLTSSNPEYFTVNYSHIGEETSKGFKAKSRDSQLEQRRNEKKIEFGQVYERAKGIVNVPTYEKLRVDMRPLVQIKESLFKIQENFESMRGMKKVSEPKKKTLLEPEMH